MLRYIQRRVRQFTPRHRADRLLSPLVVLALLFLLGAAAACTSAGSATGMAGGDGKHTTGKVERPYTPADLAQTTHVELPSFAQDGELRDSYEYALNHPDQLRYIPCYCGCELTANHKSNLECYIAGVDKDGKVVFDNHASFCSICLEITQDVKRLSAEGKSLKEIRTYIDETHSEKGPGTNTPLPPS